MTGQEKTREYNVHVEGMAIWTVFPRATSALDAVKFAQRGEDEDECLDAHDEEIDGSEAISIFDANTMDEIGTKRADLLWEWNLCPHCGSENIIKVSSDGEATPCTTLCEDCHMYSGYADDAGEGSPKPETPAAPAAGQKDVQIVIVREDVELLIHALSGAAKRMIGPGASRLREYATVIEEGSQE